jgi:hypothetical protein
MPNQTRVLEIAVTSIALWWGVILLLPIKTFTISSSYNIMSAIANEHIWGILMLLLGAFHLLGISLNKLYIKRLSFLVATGVWFYVATLFFLGEPATTATGTYIIIGCLTGWLYVKEGDRSECK